MKNHRAIFNRNTWQDSIRKPKQKFITNNIKSEEYDKVSFDWIQ
jgi:hypothetical protein